MMSLQGTFPSRHCERHGMGQFHMMVVSKKKECPYQYLKETNVSVQASRREILSLSMVGSLMLSIFPDVSYASIEGPKSLRALRPEEIDEVLSAMKECVPPIKAPLMLRLIFHDAATYRQGLSGSEQGGVNGSIRFETERPENFGLKRGVNVIRQLKERLGTYSYADLIVLSAVYAVRLTNGPDMIGLVRVGRVDSQDPDPEGRLPEESLSAEGQRNVFASMGFSPEEMVALLGSHTLGNKGFGEPLLFDNTYYVSLLKKPWENKNDKMASMIGLASDRVLPDDQVARPIITKFAESNDAFFKSFEKAFIKLSELGCA